MSVADTIRESCRTFASRTALITLKKGAGDASHRVVEEVSYRDLYERTLRLCSALSRRGLKPGSRLAVLFDNSSEMVVTEWACLLAGFVWVALNVRSSPAEMSAILEDSRPSLLLVHEDHLRLLHAASVPPDCEVLEVGMSPAWRRLLASGDPQEPTTRPGPEGPVRIRYTSGTAGQPKGAVLARRCYDASLDAVGDVIAPVEAGDTLVQVAPMTHASGAMLLPHVLVGARALLVDRFNVLGFIELVERYRGTTVFLVPTMLVRLLEELDDPRRLSSLKTIVYGGASMPVDRLARGLELLGQVFIQIYGLTESPWPVTALSREDHPIEGNAAARAERLASCGKPTTVGELRIIGPDGAALGPHTPGEIVVRGRNTMLGYWSLPGRETPHDIKGLDGGGWMHTGDIGFRDEAGFVTIVDRLHDMIVSGGFNVYPTEVEAALSSHPSVLESAVVGVPDPEWGERVHASVVLKPGMSATPHELIAHCGRLIAGYKKPRSLEIVAGLPRNPSGKILRRETKKHLV
jgi:acyl-CoA synthetase (AMP-forming)/AMP-acid ligase II